MKQPAIMLYIGDWRKDAGVQSLPYDVRGIWFELLLFMHECDTKGALALNGRPMTDKEISDLLGITPSKWSKAKQMLLDRGVASCKQISSKGKAIINRRMHRKYLEDKSLAEKRAEAGSKGGSKKQANRVANASSKTVAKALSSSSASSSDSTSPSGGEDKITGDSEDVIRMLIQKGNAAKILARPETLRRYVEGWAARAGAEEVDRIFSLPEVRGLTVLEIHEAYFKTNGNVDWYKSIEDWAREEDAKADQGASSQ